MFTPIIQLLQKNRKQKLLFIAFCFSLLSLYPIYKNFYNGAAVTTYERHIALIEGRSEYFNPWQYRMLCPLVIEGMMWIYNHTIDLVYPIEEKFSFQITQTSEPTPETKQFLELLATKGAVKYMIVFLAFRFLLNLSVFTLAFCVWRFFINNNWLVFLGLMMLSIFMGNAVIASDLTFNTYLDNVFYLLTACIILFRKHPLWLLPITVLAAFNRETAMLIPGLYFISQIDLTMFHFSRMNLKDIHFPKASMWVYTGVLYLIFISIFFGVRFYYGYQPPQIWKVAAGLPMIKLNLLSAVAGKSYFEMIGVFGVMPFIILYTFKRHLLLLRTWFLYLVPLWFAVHIYSVVIYQTRLFLVPVILVFIPMVLWLVENSYKKEPQ
jgi:hypothetical protein